MPEIVKTDDVLGGDPRIEDHRVGVYHIYQRYAEGDDTPDEIATSYDISVAEVHAALAYYTEFMPQPYPARSACEVSRLALDAEMEIEVIAAL